MSEIKLGSLTCEYKRNPVGIDVKSPRLSWRLCSEVRGAGQTAYRIQAAKDDDSFAQPVWDTGKVGGDRSVLVPYEGEALHSRTRYYFRVCIWDQDGRESGWSETAYWETGLFDASEWHASWIAAPQTDSEASPYLRTTFKTSGTIAKARLYATALGLYELFVNGSRVGDWQLTPGWTSYKNRLQYQTYDVTGLLHVGANGIGGALGPGWYKGDLVGKDKRNHYGDRTALLAQLHIAYADGREEVIGTDASWTTSSEGPVRMSEIYHGETYDARLEQSGWAHAEFDAKGWVPAETLQRDMNALVAQEVEPVRKIGEIAPVSLIRTPAGETVIDFGQNMVGWVRFWVEGEAGTEVVLKHAEVLDKDGNFYTENLRSAKQTNRYTLKGEGIEEYEPHFTFQGFRYVQVIGYPGNDLPLDRFTAVVIHSDMAETGTFECSDPLINQLQHNILWGQKGNFVDVPTDCPQRDERLGWTGDAQVFIRTAAFNMQVAPFFAKWLRDLAADQKPDGGVPFVIPDVLGEGAHSSAAWADAAVICPWTIYESYGDTRILEDQYDSMKAWIEYVRRQGDNEHLWNTGFHFGDWLGLDAKENSYKGATPEDLIATAFYAHSTRLLARTAGILGKEADEQAYSALYDGIVRQFRGEFITPHGRLAAPTQTGHVLTLLFGLAEESHRKRLAADLAKLIEEQKGHLTTGFVGTPYLCHALTQSGYHDVACKLVRQTDYPSWLFSVTKGATTIWEHWDGIKEDGSFWSKDMNSYNHYAYGSVGEWLYRVLAGLDTDETIPGYKRIVIKPQPGPGFTYAKASLDSGYGEIRSSWAISKDGASMSVDVRIPPNTTAVITLPRAAAGTVSESGGRLEESAGISGITPVGEDMALEAASGTYSFTYAWRTEDVPLPVDAGAYI